MNNVNVWFLKNCQLAEMHWFKTEVYYDTKTKDSTEWKTKYEENDKAWREKYTNRFFNNEGDDGGENGNNIPDELLGDTPTTYESLFTEVKEW